MNRIFLTLSCMIAFCCARGQGRGVLPTAIITDSAGAAGAFPLIAPDIPATPIYYDTADFKGVIRAAGDLQNDVDSVTGMKPSLVAGAPSGKDGFAIVVGTIGKSKFLAELATRHALDVKDLKGKWEDFVIATIDNPIRHGQRLLVIAGSDKRGTIYGLYELSEQLGVSPWYWWADVPAKRRVAAYVLPGRYVSGEPKVRYRGIFINDEAPCFSGWSREKFGGPNSKMYTHMFELLLRLHANFLWPAMWGNAFNEDDPENPRLADEYGIVMGTSHHEPMLRAQKEWGKHRSAFGNGEWNYNTNKAGLQDFWRQGLERNKQYESIVTMGMRGDGDKPMPDAGSAQANFRVLENIMADQRKIIEEVTHKPASQTPQLWALYSEVLDYYDQGMKVPDDMIILLCDDNWGDVRRLPDLNGPKHPGGYGMYYHVDLHGAPRSYQWLNMTPIPHMWEQLQLTYSYGVDKVWILNVGDLKPNEYPLDFFLHMAWDPLAYSAGNLGDYARAFCAEQFGPAAAMEAADIISSYCKYNGRVTAEMLNDRTYNLQTGEFEQVRDAYLALEARALRQYLSLPDENKDAYKELILHPVRAMANLYDLYYAVAMNKKLAADKDLRANYWADYADRCFARDAAYARDYHRIAGGKWDHMMDQTHIGYRSWDEPRGGNIKPAVIRLQPSEAKAGGFVFSEQDGVVVMEAEHYYTASDTGAARWTVIPDMGRTLSGMALMPYTQPVGGAAISYRLKLSGRPDSIRLRMVFNATLPFKKGGQSISAGFEGAPAVIWNINDDLNWANNYSKMYPAAAARIIETTTVLAVPPPGGDGCYTLSLNPLDPGIVLMKVIVDDGGYEQTWLKMRESPYRKDN